MRDRYEAGLKLLLIAAGCVLLVACGNLANLMLARGLKDRSQTSLRVALGASRGRLVRKALVESTLLAIIGGMLGIGVAYAGSKLILYLAFHTSGGPANYVPVDASPSGPVLLFTVAISILTGILFGIAPAWMTSHVDPVEALRGRQPFGPRRRLYRAEVAGDRTSRYVARTALGGRAAWRRACAISNIRTSASKPMRAIWSPSTPASPITSPNKWSRCSVALTNACSESPACAWWRRLFTRP